MRASALLSALLLVAGCGRLLFDVAGDASTDAPDASADADTDAAAARPTGPFGDAAILPIDRVDDFIDDDDAWLSADELVLYFQSDRIRNGDFHLWYSTRPSTAVPFEAPRFDDALNSMAADNRPSLSRDALSIVFSSRRDGPDYDLFQASRVSRESAWSVPTPIAELNGTDEDTSLGISSDGLEAVLCRGPRDSTDLYYTTRDSPSDPWQPPIALDQLNTASNECDPFIHPSGDLWFSTSRAGNRDIFVAARRGRGPDFEPPVPVPGVSTLIDEADPWVSDDETRIYFTRPDNAAGTGDSAIWTASR